MFTFFKSSAKLDNPGLTCTNNSSSSSKEPSVKYYYKVIDIINLILNNIYNFVYRMFF